MPQNRWKYPDGSVTIKLYEPFPAGESLLLKLEDKTMDYNKAALEMHETHKGKVGIVSKVEVATRDDLSTAYTPGVAEPCRKIKENPEDVYKYTFKGNMVAVVSNGTAVLGLGDIGPEAGLPVMEGKAVLFKEFGGVDAFPICIDAHDAASVIAACKAIAPTFGGINLEDIKSPECFEIEETLERELDIPVFHDDQHGTAIVVTAALINALRVVNKKMEDVHIVLNGPGAAGTAIIKMLMTAGAKDIIAVDQFGTLYKGCNSAEAHKNWLGEVTNPRQIKGGLKEALEGADVFIGVSRPGILTTELCKTMNKDAIVFAMANPTPLVLLAGILKKVCANYNGVLARYGGDEFCIACGCNSVEVRTLIASIQRELDAANAASGKPYQIEISIGCARLEPDIATVHDLIDKADQEMYHLKTRKRGIS